MKIFKSIKWRLQIWYGLILVAVLAALGFTAYQQERDRLFASINDQLSVHFRFINEALHPHPPGPGQRPFDHPPPDQMPDDMPPPENSPPDEFHLPPQMGVPLFDPTDPHNFYYVIFRNGKLFSSSTNAPTLPLTDTSFDQSQIHPNGPFSEDGAILDPKTSEAYIYHKVQQREFGRPIQFSELVLVGCSIAPEQHELKLTALKLTGVGIVILFFGLMGGWWISSRAIRPVADISATAVKISAGDLSQRINASETESELGQLAVVLNSTFARLEAAFAQQKQFASDAAHELRTPVSVILTQTQTALARDREAGDYKQTVEACQRAAQRMRKLIGALLELARLDAGQEQMKRLPFDFSRTIADCVELVRPLADKQGIKIYCNVPSLEMTGDAEKLGLVVTNLLTNAIQYNHDGGEIKIAAQREGGMAVLTVSDTGQGIPAEDLPRVFERFYRADKSRSSGNAGLGLAISKAIITAHGGTIDVSSQENVGTTFTIRLPA